MKRTVLVLFEITWEDSEPGRNWQSQCTMDGDVRPLYHTGFLHDVAAGLAPQMAWNLGSIAARERWDPFPARRADS